MTFDEYNKQIGELEKKLRLQVENGEIDEDGFQEKISEFQTEHMNEFLEEYKKSINGDEAKQFIYDYFYGAVKNSTSGSWISDIGGENAKELAEKVDNIFWKEIGHFLLDGYVYLDTYTKKWCLDCMWGGNYIPYWDGWFDD